MGTIAEVSVPATEFALRKTLRRQPSVSVEVQRVVARGPTHLVSFLWARADDFDALRESLEADPSVESPASLSEFDGERLYRMSWTTDVGVVGRAVVEQEATVLSAVAADGRWRFRLCFPDRLSLARTRRSAAADGLSLNVERRYELTDGGHDRRRLTDRQRETLVKAYELDYYDFPHGVTTEQLGDEFDISAQAVADRLRRGHGNLVEEVLVDDGLHDRND